MAELKPTGQLFTHNYLERGAPVQDSELFRRRLGGYIESKHYDDHWKLSEFIKYETGLTVSRIAGNKVWLYQYENFFVSIKTQYVLNAITIIWRYFWEKYKSPIRDGYYCQQASSWHNFVERAIREENLSYSLDEQCGVHFLVDQEFEHNRASVLRCLELTRYAGVRAAFEAAHRYLENEPIDTKAAVRSMFEGVEILAKIMVDTKNLNKWVVENKLKQLAQTIYTGDDTAIKTVGTTFDGIAQWVDALHNYRHGQGKHEPVAPPVGYAVYALSTGAAILRWLLEIDAAHITRSNMPQHPTSV